MRKTSTVWLNLCLSSLMVAVSPVAATPVKTSASTQSEQILAQSNPCAGKNPCASKKGNVGGPLARQLQGKPVVVDIYASWCPACKNIAPTLSQLKKDYAGKAHFVVLDVSDKAKAAQAQRKAQELGLGRFFEANKSQTGMVAIIDPASGNILTQHRNNAKLADYTSVINAAISSR